MKSILLSLTLLFSATAVAGPADAVSSTVGQLLTVLQNKNAPARIQGMCQIVRARTDLNGITNDLLGTRFAHMAQDAQGINAFRALLPSVIVTEFASQLSDVGTQYTVNPVLVPKGSDRVGVRVNIGSTPLTITVSRANNKVLDVEWRGVSLMQTKRQKYQQRLIQSWQPDPDHSKPVTDLVNYLINTGNLIRCN